MKELLKKENASSSEIKTKLDSLNTAAMKLGEIMYKQNQDGAKEPSDVEGSSNDDVKAKEEKDQADGKNKKDEDIVDADFEEVSEDKEKKSN